MNNHGIKISKPSYDIKTANLKDQVFNSEHNSLKIWKTGKVAINVPELVSGEVTGSTTVAHGLGYIPFYLTYYTLTSSTLRWFQDSLDDSLLFANFVTPFSSSDSTNLTMSVLENGNPKAAWTAYCSYIILIDKAYE